MTGELLSLLCEPDSGAELVPIISEWRGGEIWEGTLRSALSGREYPVRGGIPRFVPDESYSGSFGLQWNRFAQVQLDSANGTGQSRQRFETETGWGRDQLDGEWVLDAGCGCGRFAEVAAGLGAKVIAMDYSSAVDAAARNLSRHQNVFCVQGDILHPPIRQRSVPYLYSIGVLQHTPAPRAALASLLSLVAPGGCFAATIYARRWYTPLYSKYRVRPLTRRLSPATLLRLVEAVMPVMFPITNLLYAAPAIGKVAQFVIPVANYVDRTEIPREQRYQEAVLDTFDMLSPAFDGPMTASEVEAALVDAGLQEFKFVSRVPINIIGSVPRAPEARWKNGA